MDLNKFAKEVHDNSCKHGWWDGERDDAEIIALIHSEWSEALEEYRAGRPLVWHNCCEGNGYAEVICETGDETTCLNYEHRETCKYRSKKPDGIAVELIDGCIRILDYIASLSDGARRAYCFSILAGSEFVKFPKRLRRDKLPDLIALLHGLTNLSMDNGFMWIDEAEMLCSVICAVFWWIKENGLDPEVIMQEKHEYNKTREYRHGKVC